MPYKLQQQRDQATKIAALEKEVKELRTKTAEKEPDNEPSSLMGSGLGGRLMIGGPSGGPHFMGNMPNGGMMAQPTGFY